MVQPVIKQEYVLICDDVRAEANGKSILIGVYGGDIGVRDIPFVMPRLCFYIGLRFSEGGIYSIRAHLEYEGEVLKSLGLLSAKINAEEGGLKVTTVPLQNIPFDKAGRYTLKMYQDGITAPFIDYSFMLQKGDGPKE